MIDKMSARFGKSFGFIHDEPGLDNPVLEFYSFPTIETLASDPKVEQILRELGFGYRAKYIAQTARILEGRGGIEWCKSLRSLSYPETKQGNPQSLYPNQHTLFTHSPFFLKLCWNFLASVQRLQIASR